jgi:hypothetical protein
MEIKGSNMEEETREKGSAVGNHYEKLPRLDGNERKDLLHHQPRSKSVAGYAAGIASTIPASA